MSIDDLLFAEKEGEFGSNSYLVEYTTTYGNTYKIPFETENDAVTFIMFLYNYWVTLEVTSVALKHNVTSTSVRHISGVKKYPEWSI